MVILCKSKGAAAGMAAAPFAFLRGCKDAGQLTAACTLFYFQGGKEMNEELLLRTINENVFAVWFLIGAALVFWMQAGFAMVETGFTRAKNAGNILMKNLMDFCIGTVVFILIGFSLLLGEDMMGIIGRPGFDLFTGYATSCSAPPLPRSFPGRWPRGRSSFPTAFIPQ